MNQQASICNSYFDWKFAAYRADRRVVSTAIFYFLLAQKKFDTVNQLINTQKRVKGE